MRETSRGILGPGPGGHRPDVDGLRAVAVLAVILFHLDARSIPGGYAGVDVFFAISGFLLTRNVLADVAAGHFSVADFYRRRVRRIALPMLVVIATIVAAAQVLLLPEDALRTAQGGTWSAAALANAWFWRNLDTGYFSREAHEAPLLHLWSLGVEEQFYLLWPLILPVAARRLRAPLALSAAIALVAIGSFAAGQALLARDRLFAFYMLPTRAGGLLLGALAAVAVHSGMSTADATAATGADPALAATKARGAAIGRDLVAGVGALLVIGSFAALSEGSPYPGWRAALPALGASLVLLAGAAGPNSTSRWLSSPPLVAIGIVSYSAYLWHWPLVAFHRYAHGEPGWTARLVIGMLTAALAWASWRWVERPARRSTASLGRVFLRQWALPSGLVFVLAALAIATGGHGPRALTGAYAAELARVRGLGRLAGHAGLACDRKRLTERDLSDPRCLVGPPEAPAGVVLWGDSNAAHHVGLLEVFARAGGFRFRNFDAYACAPVPGDPAPFVPADRVEDCVASLRLALPRLRDFPVVVLAAVWQGYGDRPPFLEETLRLAGRLVAEGHDVVLLGKVPTIPGWDRSCLEKALSIPWLDCPTERFEPLAPTIRSANDRLREFARTTPGVWYFDATDLLCADARGCTAFDEDGAPLYFDDSHLTLAGSRRVGERVLRERGLPEAFAAIAARLRREEPGPAQGSPAPPPERAS